MQVYEVGGHAGRLSLDGSRPRLPGLILDRA